MPGDKSLPPVSWLPQQDAVLLSVSLSAPKHPHMGGLLLLRGHRLVLGGKPGLPFFQGFSSLRLHRVGSTGQAEVSSSSQE